MCKMYRFSAKMMINYVRFSEMQRGLRAEWRSFCGQYVGTLSRTGSVIVGRFIVFYLEAVYKVIIW